MPYTKFLEKQFATILDENKVLHFQADFFSEGKFLASNQSQKQDF